MATKTTKSKAAKVSRPRLSESDYRCIRFAKVCGEIRCEPGELADLCALTRRAALAGAKACNVPNYTGDGPARARVDAVAERLGLVVDWSAGLWPTFYRRPVEGSGRCEITIPS